MKKALRKKIVVVDDDEFIRKTFFLIFHEDYDVYLAGDGEEALVRFNGSPVDLIITDFRLPKLNGMEMVSRFRKNGYAGEVFLITAYPGKVDRSVLRRLDVSRFFAKPLDLDALTNSVNQALRGNHWEEEGVFTIGR